MGVRGWPSTMPNYFFSDNPTGALIGTEIKPTLANRISIDRQMGIGLGIVIGYAMKLPRPGTKLHEYGGATFEVAFGSVTRWF